MYRLQPFALVLALIVASSAGCISSRFTNPPFDLGKATFPDELIGAYRSLNNEDEVGFIHIGRAGSQQPQGAVRMLLVGTSKDQGLYSIGMLAFATKINSGYLVTLPIPKSISAESSQNQPWLWTERFDEKNVEYYWVCRITLKDSKLSVSWPDEEYLAEAIKAGKLTGEVSGTSNGTPNNPAKPTGATVTSSSVDLEKFVKEHFDKGLFKPAEASHQKE